MSDWSYDESSQRGVGNEDIANDTPSPDNSSAGSEASNEVEVTVLEDNAQEIESDGDSIQMTGKCKIYLVGTAHFSVESQNDVRQTIRETQPDVVMVELCNARVSVLALDEETILREARNLTTEKMLHTIRESGVVQGILHIMLLSMSAHITKQLGMAPGGEFRAAFQEVRQTPGCRLHLGDRPIQITLQRALGSLSLWQKLQLAWALLTSRRQKITQEEVERCKRKDLLEEILREMAGEFPSLHKIFVDERDQYMAYCLHQLLRQAKERRYAAMPYIENSNGYADPVVIVGVVGIGHVPGIAANWTKPLNNVSALLEIPVQSRARKLMGIGGAGALLGLSAYALYRGFRFMYRLLW